MQPRRRVVITGIGIVSPLGHSKEETWTRVVQGESAARPITQFAASNWPTRIACEVQNFSLPENAVATDLRCYLNRPSEFGASAALDAIEESRIIGTVDPHRFGVAIGASIGALSPQNLARMLAGMEVKAGLPSLSATIENTKEPYMVIRNHPGTLAAILSARWGALGPVTTIHTACASSGQSIGQAYLQIQRGEADAMIAGGADSLAGELLLAGFCLLGALSTRNDDPSAASRPFDKDRDGFVASEGAAILILEERERALARNAPIYAELAGYGETESAYRITDLPEDGRGIVEAMELAIRDSGLEKKEIHHINAHGTSTQLNDRVETHAIRRVFGSHGFMPMTSSTKSEIGHLISAAGAMEAAFITLAVQDGLIPPTRNLWKSDCGEGVDLVAHEAKRYPIYAAMSNSIGFGGSNSVVIVKRHEV
jgi:3-oxoacyl-[acyl-carrier-protein] synthase II